MLFEKNYIPWNKGKKGLYHPSEETKRKIGLANKGKSPACKGKHLSQETIEKIRRGNIGKHHTEETKNKLRLINTGRKLSEETRRKVSEHHRHYQTEETKYKISQAQKGKKVDPSVGRKISMAKKGKPSPKKGTKMSSEQIEKLRQAKLGCRQSEETKRKISEYQKGRKKPQSFIDKVSGENNYFFGKHLSSDHRLKLSIAHKGKKLSKEHYMKVVSCLRKSRRGRISKPQLKLFEIIKNLYPEYNVELECGVKTRIGWRFIDVGVPSLKIGFEYDDPAFHGGFRGNKEGDLERHNAIINEGWFLIHYTNINEFPE